MKHMNQHFKKVHKVELHDLDNIYFHMNIGA